MNLLHTTQSLKNFPKCLWNPKVNSRVHNSPPLIPILSQLYLLHTTQYDFPKIHFNIIFTPSGLFPSGIPTKILYAFHTCYILCPSHSPWLYHSNFIWRRVQFMKLLIIQCSLKSALLQRKQDEHYWLNCVPLSVCLSAYFIFLAIEMI
jgi:hypothetical protein